MTSLKKSHDRPEEASVSRPLHEQVKETILKRIVLGEWGEGDTLPAETELARMLGVSYGTMRRAMMDLTQEGLIVRRRRTGTVITGRSPHLTLARFYHYFRLHTSDGHLINTDASVLEIGRRPATAQEAEALRIATGTELGTMLRLRCYEGRRVMIDRLAISMALAPDFPSRAKDAPPMIYKWLLEHHGLRIAAVREKVTAHIATREDCQLLDLDPSRPHALLEIDEIAFDGQNAPLLLMNHRALTDEHCYVNEVR